MNLRLNLAVVRHRENVDSWSTASNRMTDLPPSREMNARIDSMRSTSLPISQGIFTDVFSIDSPSVRLLSSYLVAPLKESTMWPLPALANARLSAGRARTLRPCPLSDAVTLEALISSFLNRKTFSWN